MATSKQILEATPLAEEFRQYGRREERENSRRRLLNALEDAIASRAPGADAGWLRDIHDMDQLERIHREVLRAPDARALRDVLSRRAPNR